MKPKQTQKVIFKADDIREHPTDVLSAGWTRFVSLIDDAGVTAALGLIGDSLQDPSTAYIDRLNELAKSAAFELWNHGYDHYLNQPTEDGGTYSEFHNTTLEHQTHHLSKTQQLAQDVLGLTLTTFGAPGNHIDDNTWVALDAESDILAWFYGDPRSKKHILERTINVEHPVHHPDFTAFSNAYQSDIPVLTLQLHPGGWDDFRFTQFETILSFLKDQGCDFVNPEALATRTAP
jgi:peptidoglycan/xylan/chitin deacetylase (PgdA/CDA1 family)